MTIMEYKLQRFEEKLRQSNVQAHVKDDEKPSTDKPLQTNEPSTRKNRKRHSKAAKQRFSRKTPNSITLTNPIFIGKQDTYAQTQLTQKQQAIHDQAPLGDVEAGSSSNNVLEETAPKPHPESVTKPNNRHKCMQMYTSWL